MVRLKVFSKVIPRRINIFQFLNGAIKSPLIQGIQYQVMPFQFLNGAIKSVISSALQQRSVKFQFLNGAIKSFKYLN